MPLSTASSPSSSRAVVSMLHEVLCFMPPSASGTGDIYILFIVDFSNISLTKRHSGTSVTIKTIVNSI